MNGVAAEATDLLQQLIRNACVNDGSPASGQEARSVDLLSSYLGGRGMDVERYEPSPGRANLIARIEGYDPSAPSLILMGHTDVVPVNPDRWRHDPFGGELIDGEVWGRGAIDMLNLTSTMAVATRRLADRGFRPRGTLVYLAVADEEALGTYGAGWLTQNRPEAVRAEYVITEFGGMHMPFPGTEGPKLPIVVGEKGTYWVKLRVLGTAGHGSMPLRTDNALVKAAEIVRRIDAYQPETSIHEVWQRFVAEAELPPEVAEMFLDPESVRAFAHSAPDVGLARLVHACTQTTFAPTVIRGGMKTNVIPDTVELEVDIRTLPGQSGEAVHAMLQEAVGDLQGDVEISAHSNDEATISLIDTPLWETIRRAASSLVPGATTVPFMVMGATDARFFRRAGATAYGAGLFSDRIPFGDFVRMFHGDNERVDQESLRLSTELWELVARDLLS